MIRDTILILIFSRKCNPILSLSRHLHASFGIWNVALLLRRIGVPPLLRCCVPDDTAPALMMDLLLSSIACTCASIVAQKASIGTSTLSSPNGLRMKRRARKEESVRIRRLLLVKMVVVVVTYSTSFEPITMRNMIIMDARKTMIGVIQPMDIDQTTDAIIKNVMQLVMVMAS
jgi:hypothetical protein